MTSEVAWEIPEPQSACEVRLDDSTVTTLRRYGNPEGRRLFLSHGNGLAIDLYYPFWSLLADDFDLIVYDLRNHGRNGLTTVQRHDIPTFISDLYRILDRIDECFGPKPRIGVYHSFSALIALLSLSPIMAEASGSRGPNFSTLVLFDPPLYRPSVSETKFDELAELLARRTRRRGNRFPTLASFVDLVGYSPSLARVVPGVHELMARTTLRKAAGGAHYELRCPPEYEARIVDYVRGYAGMVDFENLPCHIKVLGADPTLPFAYLPTFDLMQMETVDYDFLPEATHYLQLEKPAECVAAMREYLDRAM
ncbi:MAG: alpha/beta hydrolase [Gammaproteobacteria bacterium]|nr:alpha/beta hydrolase [Gammaproteobacteria bacterium]